MFKIWYNCNLNLCLKHSVTDFLTFVTWATQYVELSNVTVTDSFSFSGFCKFMSVSVEHCHQLLWLVCYLNTHTTWTHTHATQQNTPQHKHWHVLITVHHIVNLLQNTHTQIFSHMLDTCSQMNFCWWKWNWNSLILAQNTSRITPSVNCVAHNCCPFIPLSKLVQA